MEKSPHQQKQKRWREHTDGGSGMGWGRVVPSNCVAPGKHEITIISSGPP